MVLKMYKYISAKSYQDIGYTNVNDLFYKSKAQLGISCMLI